MSKEIIKELVEELILASAFSGEGSYGLDVDLVKEALAPQRLTIEWSREEGSIFGGYIIKDKKEN